MVNEAIPAANGDRELPFAKRLHVVEKGAIYRLETTDWGKSYHGYPYRGALTRTIEGQLRAMATQKACLGEYEDWLKDYIELG